MYHSELGNSVNGYSVFSGGGGRKIIRLLQTGLLVISFPQVRPGQSDDFITF